MLAAVALAAISVLHAGGRNEVNTLKGLSEVALIIEKADTGAKELGLTDEVLRTDIELKLRLARLKIIPIDTSTSQAWVHVSVTTIDDGSAADIAVQMRQDARLVRNQNIFAVAAVTWNAGKLMSQPTALGIRQSIKDIIDQLLNDWLKANEALQ